MRFCPRVLSAVGVTAVAWLLTTGNALAENGVVYDGDDPGPGYTALEALGLFVGIPATVLAIIILGVFGPGWVRGRSGDMDEAREPMWLSSPAGTMGAPSGPGMLPATPTDHLEKGGASARW